VADVTSSTFVRRMRKASEMIRAATYFLEAIADLLRQLVHVAGWIVLLTGLTNLLLHPNLSPEHLAIPGAGALAILQNLIRSRQRHDDQTTVLLDGSSQLKETLLPMEVETESEAKAHQSQVKKL
jgi:hypothetical protein